MKKKKTIRKPSLRPAKRRPVKRRPVKRRPAKRRSAKASPVRSVSPPAAAVPDDDDALWVALEGLWFDPEKSDVTVAVPFKSRKLHLSPALLKALAAADTFSLEPQVQLRCRPGGGVLGEARAVICYAEQRQFFSVTLRFLGKPDFAAAGFRHEPCPMRAASVRYFNPGKNDPRKPGKFLFQFDAIADVLAEQFALARDRDQDGRLVSEFEAAKGLVVLSGATKCGKSQLARALALKYMLLLRAGRPVASRSGKRPGKRPPAKAPPWNYGHLVSFEDPLEKWEFNCGGKAKHALSPGREAHEAGMYFTPRERQQDAADLAEATRNALRQTPKCFLIGEIRDDREWPIALDLATSGHLVLTTTHAGTLSETFTRIFQATAAHTEATRALVVNSLRGVVHLKGTTAIPDYGSEEQIFPCCWRRTTQSVASLVCDGISSIIPDGQNVLGRRALATKILARMEAEYPRDPRPDDEHEKAALDWAALEDILEA